MATKTYLITIILKENGGAIDSLYGIYGQEHACNEALGAHGETAKGGEEVSDEKKKSWTAVRLGGVQVEATSPEEAKECAVSNFSSELIAKIEQEYMESLAAEGITQDVLDAVDLPGLSGDNFATKTLNCWPGSCGYYFVINIINGKKCVDANGF